MDARAPQVQPLGQGLGGQVQLMQIVVLVVEEVPHLLIGQEG